MCTFEIKYYNDSVRLFDRPVWMGRQGCDPHKNTDIEKKIEITPLLDGNWLVNVCPCQFTRNLATNNTTQLFDIYLEFRGFPTNATHSPFRPSVGSRDGYTIRLSVAVKRAQCQRILIILQTNRHYRLSHRRSLRSSSSGPNIVKRTRPYFLIPK